jgi:Flp pilus assembly pilin Flp
MKRTLRIFACESGATAVELGIILTVFLSMLFGIINIAMALWTQGSLHYAAEKAARCAAVASTSCSTTTLIQTYALDQYYGLSLGGTLYLFGDGMRQYGDGVLHLCPRHPSRRHILAAPVGHRLRSLRHR